MTRRLHRTTPPLQRQLLIKAMHLERMLYNQYYLGITPRGSRDVNTGVSFNLSCMNTAGTGVEWGLSSPLGVTVIENTKRHPFVIFSSEKL
ncbi:hypothetical protein LSH36_328g03000 [Paralvinella palmiformis]|uniref:Uncharacterized protein n=1 Tax=Paralvinella palmiformis TaxID=53620 RepID=A0AAD9N325_9ANNE|nr:hypothetical protein LSH36_328g03000 [Paralvinella palmiformis]